MCNPIYSLTALVLDAGRRARADEAGASLVEYALLLALIVVVAIAAVIVIGDVTSNSLNNAANNFPH